MADQSPTPAEQKIIELLHKIAGTDKKDKQEETRQAEKRSRKETIKALRDNGLALIGLSTGMFSLSKIVGNQLDANKSLAESLGQTAQATEGMAVVTKKFITGQQGFEQKVKLFADAVSMGMSDFANTTLQFGMQLKIMGVQNKTAFQLIRANTQALGLNEEATLLFANQLVSTAAANKDSISGLIDAINGMRDAMVDTTVELGPKAALNAQKIAAMMSQGNSELQEASAKFVKSFLTGSSGYLKAAKLGVQFTGQESTAEMARKFETILENIQMRGAGMQGAGSQFFFDAMEASMGLSREDFNLQQQIGTNILSLKEASVQQLSRESARINVQQQMLELLDGIQSKIQQLLQFMASTFADWKGWIVGQWKEIWDDPTNYLKKIKGKIGQIIDDHYPNFWVWAKGIGYTLTSIAAVWTGSKLLSLFGMAGGARAAGTGGALGWLASKGKGLIGGMKNMVTKIPWKSMVSSLKTTGKGLLTVAKKAPGTGFLLGLGAAGSSALQGNWMDAGVHFAAGALTTLPVGGTTAAIALEAGYHGTKYLMEERTKQDAELARTRTELTAESLEIQRESLAVQQAHLEAMQITNPGFRK